MTSPLYNSCLLYTSGCQPVLVPIFEFGNDDFVFDTPDKDLVGYSLVRRLTCGVVVHTETDGVDVGIRFQPLKQHLIPDTAGGSIACLLYTSLHRERPGAGW